MLPQQPAPIERERSNGRRPIRTLAHTFLARLSPIPHVDNFPETSFPPHARAPTRFETTPDDELHEPVNSGKTSFLVRVTRRERETHGTHDNITTTIATATAMATATATTRSRIPIGEHDDSNARWTTLGAPAILRLTLRLPFARSFTRSLTHSHTRSGLIRRRTTLAGPPLYTPRLPPPARNEGVRWGGINMSWANAGNSRAGPSPPSTRWIHTPASLSPVSCVLHPHPPRLSYCLHPHPPFFFFVPLPRPLCFPWCS